MYKAASKLSLSSVKKLYLIKFLFSQSKITDREPTTEETEAQVRKTSTKAFFCLSGLKILKLIL